VSENPRTPENVREPDRRMGVRKLC